MFSCGLIAFEFFCIMVGTPELVGSFCGMIADGKKAFGGLSVLQPVMHWPLLKGVQAPHPLQY
jgi:hypothetical protein